MVTETTKREYTRLRRIGFTASSSLYHARIKEEWENFGGVAVYDGDSYDDSQNSFVRLLIQNDDDWSNAMDFDCGVKGCKQDCRFHKAEANRIEKNGVCGIVGQYRNSLESKWISADSVWGFVGDDWKDSGYDADIMQSALSAYKHFAGC